MNIQKLAPERLLTTLLKIALGLTIVPFLLLSLFSQPLGDDICVAVGAIKSGFWNYQVEMYYTWTGRYFSWALVSLYPFFADLIGPNALTTDFFRVYPLMPILVLIVLFLAIFIFIKSLISTLSLSKVSNQNAFWSTTFLVALYLNAMPSPAEGVYWISGSGTYTFPSSLLLLLLSLLLLPLQAMKPKSLLVRVIYAAVCVLLTIAIVGSNEIFALILLVLSLLAVVSARYFRHSGGLIWTLVLITTALSTAASFLAPGNAARKLLYQQGAQPSPIFLAVRSSYNFIENLGSWIADPVLLGATLLLLPTAISLGNQVSFLRQSSKKLTIFLFCIAVWLVLILSTFFLPYLAGGYPAKRVSNVVYLVFLLGWFLNLFLLTFLFFRGKSQHNIVPKYILISAQVVMIIGLLCRGNFISSIEELLLYAPDFRSQMSDRYALIQQESADNQKAVFVPALTKYPPMIVPMDAIQGQDISEDVNYVYNKCSAKFFNLDSIAIKPKNGNK